MVAKSRPTPIQPHNRPVTPSLAAADVGTKEGGAGAASTDSASVAVVAPAAGDSDDHEANVAPATGDSPADASKPNGGSDYAASDQQITIDVKSEISRDDSNKGAAIEVSTDHGVVALSGTVPDQTTLDHVKELVARVKGVTGVNASALSVASLVSSAIPQ
jgi:osmotically-inducible protein OsmY